MALDFCQNFFSTQFLEKLHEKRCSGLKSDSLTILVNHAYHQINLRKFCLFISQKKMYESNKKTLIFQCNMKSKTSFSRFSGQRNKSALHSCVLYSVFLVSADSRTNPPCTVVSCTVRHELCRRCGTTEKDQTGNFRVSQPKFNP